MVKIAEHGRLLRCVACLPFRCCRRRLRLLRFLRAKFINLDRRPRTTISALGELTLLASSTSITTTVSTVPTGERSPDAFMYYNYTSFYVMEDGSMITYAVEYSYGNNLISSHVNISSLCRIAGLREFVFQLFYFHKGA